MKEFRYKGYFGQWFIPSAFIIILITNLYFYSFESANSFHGIFFISGVLIIAFAVGLIEGHSMGRNGFIEEMEEDQDISRIYLKRFIKKDE